MFNCLINKLGNLKHSQMQCSLLIMTSFITKKIFTYLTIIRIKFSMNRIELISRHISSEKPFKGKTVVVTGGSRGIGLAIAKALAKDGANVAILAKTAQPHPKLPGTIYTAAKQIEQLGGKALPLLCDVRSQSNVIDCINKTVQKFGGIDILINNASAINLVGTQQVSMKKYDLMHQINIRGTFMVSKYCIPHLKKSKNPHIINLSSPLSMEAKWFKNHLAYTMAKYGMSMCVLGMAEQFKDAGIAVNGLWPRTSIATAAVQNLLGGEASMKVSRTDQIMADAAYLILKQNSRNCTGNFFIDEQVLRKHGVTDFSKYRCDPNAKEEDLMPDFFI